MKPRFGGSGTEVSCRRLSPGILAYSAFAHPRSVAEFFAEHGQHNVAFLFFKLQDNVNGVEFIGGTKLRGRRRTQKVHGVRAFLTPGINVFEVQASFFLLKKYSHMLHSASLPLPCASTCRPGSNWSALSNRSSSLR